MHNINTKAKTISILIAGLLLANSAMAAAKEQPMGLLAAQAGDLKVTAIATHSPTIKSEGAPVRREAAALSWASDSKIDLTPKTPVEQSREYYHEVSGAELATGITLNTTSARALVRMQPLGQISSREAIAIDPLQLIIKHADGRSFTAGSGMEMLVSAEKLAKADSPFAPGTSAFRMHPNLGAGNFKLQAVGVDGSARYLINVVEPDSKLTMTLQTGAGNYLHGQELVVSPAMIEKDGQTIIGRHGFTKLEGFVTSPGGRNFPVSFKPGKGGDLRATLPLNADEAPTPGLWEAHASGQAVVKGQTVRRSLRLAFAVAMPVARLSGNVALFNAAEGVGLRFGIEAGSAGRYEVRGLLYGMVGGVMTPVGVAHSAKWIEAGNDTIELNYNADLLAGVSPPFEVRDLTLLDQSRMGVLHKQARGLVVEDKDAAFAGLNLSHRDLAPGRAKAAIPVKH